MPLLIDTFNVLHTTGVLPPEQAGIDVADLIGLLAVSRYRRQPITLICDGSGRDYDDPGCCGGVQVRFSGSGRPADDIIIDLVRRAPAPRRLLVVSTDQEIARAARRRKCRTLRSDALLHQLAADLERAVQPAQRRGKPINVPLPRSEVQRWIEAFELGEQEAHRLASQSPTLPPHLELPERQPDVAQPDSADAPRVSNHPEDDLLEAMPDALPDDLIEQAKAMLREPISNAPSPKSRGDSTAGPLPGDVADAARQDEDNRQDQRDTPDPMRNLMSQYDDYDALRRQARQLGHRRISELTDEQLDAIDMRHLLGDVAPIDNDDDEHVQ